MDILNLQNVLDAILGKISPMRHLIDPTVIGNMSESLIRGIVSISLPSAWWEVAVYSLLDAKSRIISSFKESSPHDNSDEIKHEKIQTSEEVRSIECEGKHCAVENPKNIEKIRQSVENIEKVKLPDASQETLSLACEVKNSVGADSVKIENSVCSGASHITEKTSVCSLNHVNFSASECGPEEKVYDLTRQISVENKEEILKSEYCNVINSIANLDNRNPISGLNWVDFVKMSSDNMLEFKNCCEKLPMGHKLSLLRIFSVVHKGKND